MAPRLSLAPLALRLLAARRNPGGRHLPRATRKDNRMYEHVLAAERERGTPLAEAKSIAAATVRAYQKRRRRRA